MRLAEQQRLCLYIILLYLSMAGEVQFVTFTGLRLDMLVIFNSQDLMPLPIALEDIKNHHKYMRANLQIAKAMNLPSSKNKAFPYPASGSTAAFGSFLTGVNLDDYKNSIVKYERGLLDYNLLEELFPQAHALTPAELVGLIDPDLQRRIWLVMKILGGAYVGSAFLKYTLYRDHFKEKYEKRQLIWDSQERKTGIRGALQSLMRSKPVQSIQDTLDVFAHSLTFVAKSFPVATINIIEYLGDRFATQFAAPKNTMFRKSFNATLGFDRGTMDKLAVNAKTFFIGALLFGAVDVTLVAVQLLWVAPYIVGESLTPEVAVGTSHRCLCNDSVCLK